MQWYLKVLRQYADFSGRARRKEYWMYTLINAIISFALQIADIGVDAQLGGQGQYAVLSTVYGLAVLVPGLAVAARRLHDIDRSGWWQLLPAAAFVPMGLVIVLMIATSAGASQPPTALIVAFVIFILAAIAAAIVLLVWAATEGKPGPNRFGPNPKEPVPTPVPPQMW